MCGFANEDEEHFFFVCPLYFRQRVSLQNSLCHLVPLNCKTLLFGSNELDPSTNNIVILETLKFIKDTKCFECEY